MMLRTGLDRLARCAAIVGGVACLGADSDRVIVEDDWTRYELPPGWTATGEGGEYWLDAEQDVASLLLLPPDPDLSLEARLAEIEAQFLSTGVFEADSSETRELNGELIHVRRYRLKSGGAVDAAPSLLHQYSFVRSAVHVLLQVETTMRGGEEEKLFRTIHGSLEILRPPDPSALDALPLEEGESGEVWVDPDDTEAIVDSSDATVYEEPDPGK